MLSYSQILAQEIQSKDQNSSQNLPKDKSKKNAPTKVRAEKITVKRKNKLIEFSENVIVEKQDASMIADRMMVIYEQEAENNKKNKIKKIEAYDHVKLFSEESTATAQNGYYDPNENIFVLQKNVIVNNGTSIANGEKFIYNLNTKKGFFTGNKNTQSNSSNDDRVTVIIGNDIKELKPKNQKNNEQKNSQSQ